MRILLKLVKFIVIVLVVGLVALRLFLSPLVRTVVNSVLPEALGTEAHLENVEFGLLTGYTGLGGLRIGQPKGFDQEDKDLLRVGSFEAKVNPMTLRQGTLVVERLEVKDLYVHVIRDAEGRMNVEQLGAAEKPPAEAEPAPPAEEKKEAAARPIRIKWLAVRNGIIKYTDRALGKEPVLVHLADLDVELKDLLVDEAAGDGVEPAVLNVVARLKQEGLQDGRLGFTARIGSIGKDIPAVNASARLIGFDLSPFQSLVPPATLTLLGGQGLDFASEVGLKSDLLEVNGVIEMAGGSKFPFRVGGSPEKPEFDSSSVLLGTVGRLGGVVSGTASDAMETGKAAAGAIVDGAGALAGGALKTIGGLGQAVKSTAQAGLKGDVKGIGSALTEGVTSAASDVKSTVTDTAGTAVGGLADAKAGLTGEAALEAWRKSTDQRWETAWANARIQVAKAPFPPERVSKEAPAGP